MEGRLPEGFPALLCITKLEDELALWSLVRVSGRGAGGRGRGEQGSPGVWGSSWHLSGRPALWGQGREKLRGSQAVFQWGHSPRVGPQRGGRARPDAAPAPGRLLPALSSGPVPLSQQLLRPSALLQLLFLCFAAGELQH